jgi:hypothetical protein
MTTKLLTAYKSLRATHTHGRCAGGGKVAMQIPHCVRDDNRGRCARCAGDVLARGRVSGGELVRETIRMRGGRLHCRDLCHWAVSAPSWSGWLVAWPAADFHCLAQTSVANKTSEQPMGKRTSFKPRDTTSATVKSFKFDQ